MEVRKENNETLLDLTEPHQEETRQMHDETEEVDEQDEGMGDLEKEDTMKKREEADKKVEVPEEVSEKGDKKENESEDEIERGYELPIKGGQEANERGKVSDEEEADQEANKMGANELAGEKDAIEGKQEANTVGADELLGQKDAIESAQGTDEDDREGVKKEGIEYTEKEYEDGTNNSGEENGTEEVSDDVQEEVNNEGERLAKAGRVRKEPLRSKARRVDMKEFYPEESESSLDAIKKVTEEVDAWAKETEINQDEMKEYSDDEPSFLGECFSSDEDIRTISKIDVMEEMSVIYEEPEDDDYPQNDIYVKLPERELSDRVYDQICETPLSTDESFSIPKYKYIGHRKLSYITKRARSEEDPWLAKVSEPSIKVPVNSMNYLVENVVPGLKKTLIEIATYQPLNPVQYMALSLLHRNKKADEMGLDPDPRLIQTLVDAQKKKRKSVLKKPDIFFQPMAESDVDLREPSTKSSVKASSSDDEDLSYIARSQRKYKNAKKKVVIEEKEKRKILSTRSIDPGTCLGPTSLPLPVEPPTNKIATKH